MSFEEFISHNERNVLEKVNNEVKNKMKEFFNNIEDESTKNKIKTFFSYINNQQISYFEYNEDGINNFEVDRENFISENSNFDEESFDTLLGSLVNRKYLAKDVEGNLKVDNFEGDESDSKEVQKKYSEFMENKNKNYDKLLSLPRDVRIKLCTREKINIEDIMDGEVSSLIFDFKFGLDKINKEIYLNTTAGQLLPGEVQEVIKDGVVYFRSGQLGEFFTENNKRLTIHQDTHITISKLKDSDIILKERSEIKKELKIENEKDISLEDLIRLESKLRGIDSKFALTAFKETLEKTPKEKQKYLLENMLTEFDRIRGIYRISGKLDKNGKYNNRLALEMFSLYGGNNWKEKAGDYGIEDKYIKSKNDFVSTKIKMDKVIDGEITQNTIDRINGIKKFEKGKKDTIILFKIACRISGIDESWSKNYNLHKILSNESAGVVGRLNYTIKGLSMSEYRNKALSSTKNNPIGSKSTASGLGQLLLYNIDKYYPSGRKGIGNPIEEAVGFIKYIRDRYGNPDIAISVYGKKGSYINSRTGEKQYKDFKEGY